MRQHAQAIPAANPMQRTFSLMMSALLVAAFFASTLAVTGGPLHASAQAGSDLSSVVPSGSVLYMEVQLDQTSDQWTKTFDLLDRAGLSDLAQQELNASPEDVGQLAESYDLTGSAAIVFTSAEGLTSTAVDDFANDATSMTADPSSAIASSDIPEGFVVVIQPDDPQALYTQLQSEIANEASDAGTEVETKTYNGTEIQFWTSTDDTTDPTAIALDGNTVIMSVRPDDIEPVIDTIAGTLDALSTDEGFTGVQQALTTDALSFGYMDGTVLADQVASDLATQGMDLGQYTDSLNAYLGWSVYADDAGFRLDTVTMPAAGSTLPAPTSFNPSFASKFPAQALYFINGNDLAGSGIFDLVGFALQAAFSDTSGYDATPVATPTVDEAYSQLESLLGFNLKTDLLDQINGEFGMYLNAEDVLGSNPVLDAAFVSDVADEQTVADAVSKITYIVNSAASDTVTIGERQVTGGSVTSVEFSADSTGGIPVTLEYGVVGGQLLIGVNGGIDNYLDGSSKLADDPIYQQTMAALPQDNIVGVQFLNLQNLMPIIEDAAMSYSSSMDMVDADQACADYATQEEAQAAYDADQVGLWNLDLNYDGVACEDFFAPSASPEASPQGVTSSLNLLSVGTVAHTDGDMYRTSTLLLIGE